MSESPTHPDAPRADEARDDECGLLHPNGVFCDRPMGHVGSHAAYSDSPELCLSWGARSVDAPRARGETPETRVDNLLRDFQNACEMVVVLGDSNLSETTKLRAVLRNALRASLLERHRDGERLDWLERAVPSGEFRDFCNALHNQWPGSVRQLIDAAMSAPPSPERASPPSNTDDSRGHKSTSPCEKCGAMEVYVAQDSADDADFTIRCYACGMHYRVDGPDA